MRTLSEIGAFVGIPQNSDRKGGSTSATLQRAAECISTLTDAERRSMRALNDRLDTLPVITLDASNIGESSGVNAIVPVVRIGASPGAVLFTEIHTESVPAGKEPPRIRDVAPAGDVEFTLDVGEWDLYATRTGVSSTGYVSLTRGPFHCQVLAPLPVLPVEEPPVTPTISVTSVGDGSFKVSGSNFLPDQQVYILIGVKNIIANPYTLTDKANHKGEITDFPTGKICQSPGQVLVFIGQDGRVFHGQAVTSAEFDISCPLSGAIVQNVRCRRK